MEKMAKMLLSLSLNPPGVGRGGGAGVYADPPVPAYNILFYIFRDGRECALVSWDGVQRGTPSSEYLLQRSAAQGSEAGG